MATKKSPKTKARATAKRSGTKPTSTRAKTVKKPPRAAARSALAPPARGPRRAIFVDVENTSSEESLIEVLDGLKIDRLAQPTELTAVGNWRAVGQAMGRRLASLGAQLVHSAPARGVRDWSDLWVAVAAGCWLGQSSPGDVLEIVSNDRAFDAVGDAAAARGVVYRRVQHRRGSVVILDETADAKPARRSRGGRRHRRRSDRPAPHAAPPAVHAKPLPPRHPEPEPHGATRDQMVAVVERLTDGQPGRWLNLDVLERTLKAEGFSRPPGSPRLVTRLRNLKDVEVDSHGRVRLAVVEHARPTHAETSEPEPARETPAPAKRRRRRRGKGGGASAATTAEPAS